MAIKITRKLLDSYRKMKRELPILELELQDMKRGQNGFGNSTVFDYQTGFPRPQSVVGFDWELYEKREKVIQKKKEQCKAVEDWIQSIEDGKTRCIFKMYYQDGMPWERIAKKTGYSDSRDYPRLYIRDKYLKDMKIN